MSSSKIRGFPGAFAALFDSALLGVTATTLDGHFILVNRAYTAFTGYSAAQLSLLGLKELLLPADWQKEVEHRNALVAGHRVQYEVDRLYRRRDGSTGRAHVTCTLAETDPPVFLSLVEELQNEYVTRQALHESRRHFKAIFDHSHDGILLFDEEGRILELNPAAERLFGRTAAEMMGAYVGSFFEQPLDREHILEVLETRGTLRLEGTVRESDGRCRELESLYSASVMRGVHMCVARDVTDRKSLERQLRQSQKMEAVGRLAGGVAHDINNMLTAIRGYSEMIKKKLPPESPFQRYATMIIMAADRSSNITQQLLAFSRKQVIQPTLLDFRSVVADVLKLLKNLLGEDVEIKTDLDDQTGQIRADAGQIGQVVMNLAVNARDAMEHGGELFVSTRRVYLDCAPEGAIIPVARGNYIQLTMSDNGCGISPELRPHIFEPFFTTKEQGKGTGLGLATVYAIVEQMGGTIVARSEVGLGTTFEIYLPAAPAATELRTSNLQPAISSAIEA